MFEFRLILNHLIWQFCSLIRLRWSPSFFNRVASTKSYKMKQRTQLKHSKKSRRQTIAKRNKTNSIRSFFRSESLLNARRSISVALHIAPHMFVYETCRQSATALGNIHTIVSDVLFCRERIFHDFGSVVMEWNFNLDLDEFAEV